MSLREEPGREFAGPYEVRWRLEGSYRRFGYVFLGVSAVCLTLGILAGEPWMFVFSGPAMGAGLFLVFRDPREYLILEPRRRRLKLVRAYGSGQRLRREYDLRSYVRLETAQYDNRPKGLRCMILLFRADGGVDKVDDRLHDPLLPAICGELAGEAGLEFVDRGRIDIDPPPRMDDEAPVSVDA